MGTYEKCVKRNGKTYCWNTETEQIEEITAKRVEISECPESVLVDLMRLLNGETPPGAE